MPRRVDADLVYATAAGCADLPPLPAGAALEALLLPPAARFQGHAQLSKVSAGAGCALYLSVDGAVAAGGDAFGSAAEIDASVAGLLAAAALRGADAEPKLQLTRATVRVDDKAYSLALGGAPAAASSLLTLGQSGGACVELLAAAQQTPDALLPENVRAGDLQIAMPSAQAPDLEQQLAQCLVQLDVVAQIDGAVAATGPFELLKNVDAKIEAFVGASAGEILSVNVQLTAVESSTAPEVQSFASTGAASSASNIEYNPPSTQMALSIFVGFMMLTAMLLGVVLTKKQHEKRCRERYERANRAAQIHRVTLRMTQHEEDANDEEEDSLL